MKRIKPISVVLTRQAGFNAGDAMEFYQLPFSNTHKVVELDGIAGDNRVPGRFLYRISREKIVRGGCTNHTGVGESISMSLKRSAWVLHVSTFEFIFLDI